MTTLVVLRHAKSAWPEGVDDRDRPLAGRGRRDARAAGQWLREHVTVDLVVCSPAARTRQTWGLVSKELGNAPEFQLAERVYDASVADLLDVVRELPAQPRTVLLIGHNPGLSELVHELSGADLELKTSSIAVLRGDQVGAGSWELVTTATPRAAD